MEAPGVVRNVLVIFAPRFCFVSFDSFTLSFVFLSFVFFLSRFYVLLYFFWGTRSWLFCALLRKCCTGSRWGLKVLPNRRS